MEKIYSRFVSKQVLFLLLSFICAGQLWAQTPLSGEQGDSTWTLTKSPYKLTGAVTVKAGTTLTIEPGVIVQFPVKQNGGLSLTVDGTIIAKGTADNYITFQGDGASLDLSGYPIYGTNICGPVYINSPTTNSVFQYLKVDALGFGTSRSGDANYAAIDVSSSSCSITNCMIQNIRGTGILFKNSSSKPVFKNSFNYDRVALKFRNISPIVDSNSFSNTGYLDIITPLDNLTKMQNNNPLSVGTGLTADLSVGKNDTMYSKDPYYVLLEAINVPSGRTLTIQPNVLLQFPVKQNGGLSLTVDGTIIAKGTADNYITFQGDGASLDLSGYPIYGTNICGPVYINDITSKSVLQYLVVNALGFGTSRSGNANYAAIDVSSSSCSITNCTIQNIRGTGILFHNACFKPVSNNSFNYDRVALKFRNISPIVDSNSFSNTGYLDIITPLDNLTKMQNNNPLSVGTGLTADLSVGKNDTMYSKDPYYVLLEAINVPSGRTLTIQPNVLLQFPVKQNGGLSLTVDGTIIAKGTADNYITFQGDGASLDLSGYPIYGTNICGPVYIGSSSINSVFQYLKVDALGFGTSRSGNANYAAIDVSSSSFNVFNSIFQNIRGTGITIQNASPYIAATCFTNNIGVPSGGIYSTGGKGKVFHSNFAGNTSFGVKNASTTDTIDATNCWWNSPSGPNDGDNISGKVLYDPWATDQPFDCSDPSILPLTLLNFQATLANNTVNCTWQTATETNTSYFLVQRSTDGIGFTNLSKVYASGNSAATRSYSFADKSPNNGINYYRLQMVDKDGRYTYSKTVPINIAIKQPFAIYPNPVKDVLYVQVQRSVAEKVSLQIVDMQGNIVLQQSHQLSAGVTSLSANTTALAKGTYFAVIKGKTTEKKIFIKE